MRTFFGITLVLAAVFGLATHALASERTLYLDGSTTIFPADSHNLYRFLSATTTMSDTDVAFASPVTPLFISDSVGLDQTGIASTSVTVWLKASATSTSVRPVVVKIAADYDPALGDLNCDGLLDESDIGAFVVALNDAALYGEMFPGCTRERADTNRDGLINNFDIDNFTALWTEPAVTAICYASPINITSTTSFQRYYRPCWSDGEVTLAPGDKLGLRLEPLTENRAYWLNTGRHFSNGQSRILFTMPEPAPAPVRSGRRGSRELAPSESTTLPAGPVAEVTLGSGDALLAH